ncbi:MAG: spermidine synthase [Candidatus Limnocylindrales bacterium]
MSAAFVVSAFLGAALAFLLEPLIAKMLLPSFGGTAAVWTTALVFFQTALVAGYAVAHLSLRALGVRRHAIFQVAVVAIALAALPIAVPVWTRPPDGAPVALWLVLVLTAAVGLPFVALATNGPTIQRWYADLPVAGAPQPYRLFAASNAGSLVGLIAYPTLVEPNLDLTDQARWWAVGYLAFVGISFACAVALRRAMRRTHDSVVRPDATGSGDGGRDSQPPEGQISARRRAFWILLAGVPTALLVGVTGHLSTDVAAVPFLWVVPLAIYLVTLILAFARSKPIGLTLATFLLPVAAAVVWLSFSGFIVGPIELIFAIHLAALFLAALALGGRLAADRPSPRHLTEYSLLVALGGALGGLAAGIIGPLVFPVPLEEQIALVAALLLIPGIGPAARSWRVVSVGIVGTALVVAITTTPPALLTERTFYGTYRVIEPSPDRHVLYSGTTIHGMQVLTRDGRAEPRSYYYRGGPLGQVMTARLADPRPVRIGAVGLGTGAVAAYGRPGDAIEFIEIDPAVVAIARDPRLFTYLSDSQASVDVVVADGRLALERTPPASFDVLVLDAFSSDAVPVHLLTTEAFATAMATVRPGGVIAVHVSNRYLDLEPVVAAAARDLGLIAITGLDLEPSSTEGADASEWVIIARSYADVADLASGIDWRTARDVGRAAWTDRASDLLGALADR